MTSPICGMCGRMKDPLIQDNTIGHRRKMKKQNKLKLE